MITKVKFDGEEHLAIVINSSISWEDLQSDVNGLLDLMSVACNDSNEVFTSAIYSAVNIVRYFQPSTSNAFEMQRALFGDVSEITRMIPKKCEIYTEK